MDCMKREVVNELNEKEFVTSLIISDKCCKNLALYVDLNYLESDYARVVTEWVLEYYSKFKSSPKKDIISLYRAKCDELTDPSLQDLILRYVTHIAQQETINNEDYLLDRAKSFLEKKSLERYAETLSSCLEVGDLEKAKKVKSDFGKINVSETNEVSLLSLENTSLIKECLASQDEELFNLPTELNKVIGKIKRNDFIAILAGMKKGKSWFLQYLGLQAMKQKLNVVYVSMEMTREEVVQRMWKTLFGSKSGLITPGLYETSRFIENPTIKDKYSVEVVDLKVKPVENADVVELQKELRAENQYTGNMRIIAYPAFSASVVDITNRIEELASEGFVADVVVLDYSDITKPIGGGSEVRNQLDLIWKHLRGFAMRFHCCVITASQTNRGGLSSSVVSAENVAEDIRKLAHVTSMVSLEQTPMMAKKHIMRVRNIAMRNGESFDPCVFPQCLALGQFVSGRPIAMSKLQLDEENEE